MGEAELVVRFAAREPASVVEMYRRYGRLVYASTYRVLGDATLADEATRQTFVHACGLAGSFDPDRDCGSWLAGIASRTAAEIQRRNFPAATAATATAAAASPESGADGTAAPTEQIRRAWLVRGAIDRLSAQDRELLRLQHHRRLTHREISDRLGIPLESVKSRSQHAHRRLAGLLGQVRDRADVTPTPGEGAPEDRG